MIAQRRKRSFSPSVEAMESRQLLNATYTVTNPYDGVNVQGSLAWAVQASNSTQSTKQAPNTIQFATGITGARITHPTGPMYLTTSVNIVGGSQVLDGASQSQMFVTTGATTVVNFSNLTFDHCRADGNASKGNWQSGGAILCLGGGIGLYGDLFHDNIAALDGGAVYCNSGGAWVGGCTFQQNYAGLYGGAIACNTATPLVFTGPTNSYFLYNLAGVNGGAIMVQAGYYVINGTYVLYDHNFAHGDYVNPNNVYLY